MFAIGQCNPTTKAIFLLHSVRRCREREEKKKESQEESTEGISLAVVYRLLLELLDQNERAEVVAMPRQQHRLFHDMRRVLPRDR